MRKPVAFIGGVALWWVAIGLPVEAQTRYPAERNHSPITQQVAERLKAIVEIGVAQGKSDARFIKVGDSITAAPSYFMGQFVDPDHDPTIHHDWDDTRNLDRFEYLRESIDHFIAEVISDGETSFDRTSLAAEVGRTAAWAMTGDPNPLEQEIAATDPTFAIIMYGTNDIGWYGDDHFVMSWIIENLFAIVDHCIAEGIVPIISSPPPRVGYDLKMLTLSHLVRALAQARQIPFVDYHRAMMPLPDHGLGGDGVHPSVYQWNWMCHFTPAGLQYGNNLRNLTTMQAFDRALRVAVGDVPALDFEPPALLGAGSLGHPLQVDSLPFIDTNSTSAASLDVVYTFSLAETVNLRAMVVSQGGAELDISLRDSGFSLITLADGLIDTSLGAGQYFMVIETGDGSASNAGDYQVVLMDRDTTGMPEDTGIFIDGVQAVPAELVPGQQTQVTFSATVLDDGSVASVQLDLSPVGGGTTQPMTDTGDGRYTLTTSVTASEPEPAALALTATDDQANELSRPLYLRIAGSVFSDGFETGDPTRWSEVHVPRGDGDPWRESYE